MIEDEGAVLAPSTKTQPKNTGHDLLAFMDALGQPPRLGQGQNLCVMPT